jgi:hypothetical protein
MTIQPDHSTLSVEGLRDLLTMRDGRPDARP